MKSSVTILALASLGFVSSLPEPASSIDYSAYKNADTIKRDVCIIGGGSSGTYAATRLRQLGQSVVVVERESLMGGHTNTYTDPGTGKTIDYGVVVFHNISIVRDYFAYYNIDLGPVGFPPPKTNYNVDFRSGKIVDGYVPPDPSTAFGIWVEQLNKYPYLTAGINLPHPVPEDLLMPFRDFAKKYNVGDLAPTISLLGQGYVDFMDQPTLYFIKLLGPDLVRTVATGYVASAKRNNHALYDAATVELEAANSLLLSSYVISVDRGCNRDGSSNIIVKTPSGRKLIQAKKIVVSVPPKISNFKGWDLDHAERSVFQTFRNEAYYTALISNTGIPHETQVTNIGANSLYNLPSFPGVYRFAVTSKPELLDVKYGSSFEQDDKTVKKNILTELGKFQIPGVTTTPLKVKWVAYNAHVPFFEHVTAEQIRRGFYKRANALQGHRGVWYTGAAWETHDSSMIWNFTETILPGIVKG